MNADSLLSEVIFRALTAELPEPLPSPGCCQKCGPLLTKYISAKIQFHRYRRRTDWGDFFGRSRASECGTILASRVLSARSAFHAESCHCGLELWRGKNWRERQPREYQERWFQFVVNKKETLS